MSCCTLLGNSGPVLQDVEANDSAAGFSALELWGFRCCVLGAWWNRCNGSVSFLAKVMVVLMTNQYAQNATVQSLQYRTGLLTTLYASSYWVQTLQCAATSRVSAGVYTRNDGALS